MATSEIVHMINQALEAMLIGIPSVFLVLAIFYFMLKLMMMRTFRRSAEEKKAKQDGEKS